MSIHFDFFLPTPPVSWPCSECRTSPGFPRVPSWCRHRASGTCTRRQDASGPETSWKGPKYAWNWTHQSSHSSQPIIGEPSSCLPHAGQIHTWICHSSDLFNLWKYFLPHLVPRLVSVTSHSLRDYSWRGVLGRRRREEGGGRRKREREEEKKNGREKEREEKRNMKRGREEHL